MKRLFIFASLAIMAVGCQKTFVQDEVQTPIGFNTEVGKQTRTIVSGIAYPGTEKFGVYTYAYQDASFLNKVMENVEISKVGDDWKNATTTYYWPNDAKTTLDFYAYSPYMQTGVTHDEAKGYQMTSYTHSDLTCDFMVAEPVKGAKYTTNNGVVPVVFEHQMTQIQFVVKATPTTGVTFDVTNITLNGVAEKADYVQFPVEGGDKWTEHVAFADPCALTLNGNAGSETTTPVTMIPQALDEKTFTVVYTITGTGVAEETVTKTLSLVSGNVTEWAANKKITYTLTIGLQEITFSPTVVDWSTTTDDENDPQPLTPEISIN